MSSSDSVECAIRVCVRFRPLNAQEQQRADADDAVVRFADDAQSLTIRHPRAGRPDKTFVFDRCFAPDVDQTEVYADVSRSKIEAVLNGYNSTILAYGQTGSGKTYTMKGDNSNNAGVIPRIVSELFNQIGSKLQADAKLNVVVQMTYVELYQGTFRDLLVKNATERLCLRQTGTRMWIQGAMEKYVTSCNEVLNFMAHGEANRSVGKTDMNEHSSRSHAIVMLNVEQTTGKADDRLLSKLMLVDLAGSERLSKSHATGIRKAETGGINQSLHHLGRLIHQLTSNAKRSHISYRDSKLTHLLSDSIGGNSMTCLIITASPSPWHLSETMSTLEFGERAKTIRNKAHVNRERSAEEYQRELAFKQTTIEQLTQERNALQKALDELRDCIRQGGGELAQVLESVEQKTVTAPEVAQLRHRIAELEQTNASLQQDNQDMINEIRTLKDDNLQLADEAQSLCIKKCDLLQQLADLQSEQDDVDDDDDDRHQHRRALTASVLSVATGTDDSKQAASLIATSRSPRHDRAKSASSTPSSLDTAVLHEKLAESRERYIRLVLSSSSSASTKQTPQHSRRRTKSWFGRRRQQQQQPEDDDDATAVDVITKEDLLQTIDILGSKLKEQEDKVAKQTAELHKRAQVIQSLQQQQQLMESRLMHLRDEYSVRQAQYQDQYESLEQTVRSRLARNVSLSVPFQVHRSNWDTPQVFCLRLAPTMKPVSID